MARYLRFHKVPSTAKYCAYCGMRIVSNEIILAGFGSSLLTGLCIFMLFLLRSLSLPPLTSGGMTEIISVAPSFAITSDVTVTPAFAQDIKPPVVSTTLTYTPFLAQSNNTQTSADEFIRNYYAIISAGDYPSAWNMLTDNFKSKHNHSGYAPYAEWWGTVDRIDILSVSVISQNSARADMYVELSYYYKNGKVDTYDLMLFALVHLPAANTWAIEDAELIRGAR